MKTSPKKQATSRHPSGRTTGPIWPNRAKPNPVKTARALLEGVPVDATVRDADAESPLESIPIEDIPIAIPAANTPSEPVWSLFSDPPHGRAPIADAVVTHSAAPEPPAETVTPAPAHTERAKPAPTETSDPDAPSRKGWWQRPFRIRD